MRKEGGRREEEREKGEVKKEEGEREREGEERKWKGERVHVYMHVLLAHVCARTHMR